MRFYANENFAQPAVEALRSLGHNVLTTSDTGKSGHAIPDDEVLSFATKENRVVLTFNRRDFIRLHNENPGHAGIIVCSYDPNFEQLAKRIHDAILVKQTLTNDLLRINRAGS